MKGKALQRATASAEIFHPSASTLFHSIFGFSPKPMQKKKKYSVICCGDFTFWLCDLMVRRIIFGLELFKQRWQMQF